MGLTETLIRGLAVAVLGDTRLPYQGTEYNLSKPLSRMTVKEAILRFNPDIDPATSGSLDLARRCARERGLFIEEGWGLSARSSSPRSVSVSLVSSPPFRPRSHRWRARTSATGSPPTASSSSSPARRSPTVSRS